MYVPIMKNRKEELIVIKNMNGYFNDSMIPLIELIKDEHEKKYEIDENTGKFIYEQKAGKTRRNRIGIPPTEADIITLKAINERLNGKKAFIEFFRFSEGEYDKKKTYKNIELAFRLSRDFAYYRQRMLEIGNYANLIPVISIKSGFKIGPHILIKFINDLKLNNQSIVIRITDYYLEEYAELLETHLRSSDYIMLDIRDKNADSKFLELEEFQELETDAKKILLNSPRSQTHKNGDFENLVFTGKINNQVANIYKEYNLDGFGDFGGLKDALPEEGGSNGKGSALGLIYLKEKNAFFSVVNHDTDKGVRGYEYVRSEILQRLNLLDRENHCLAIKRIKDMGLTFGSWGTWNNLTLTRYIQQQSQE
ncbi:beta family protein [Bacillus sp. 1NLA3E]|uniref:beta family protein n=1 Tax=Bacillus sp. 1NLA3E TaxID=666686 RepID=UPI000247EDF0|nr:hypothetical protein [Bacillus sp. 1NLA3E]AGK51997.1 hypothetical protein B1NLA3E_01065 [Bacillus sp. 1NLA3E]